MSPIERSAGGGGGGFSNPMTTKGDIIIENAVPAPARLGIGTTGQALEVSSGGLPAWQSPPGFELDYGEKNSNTTSNSTTPVAVITGNSVTYDGATRIKAEFWCNAVFIQTNATGGTVSLFEGVTEIGSLIGIFLNTGTTLSQMNANGYGVRFFTPAAGAHTYSVKVYRDTGTGLIGVQAGAGGADTAFPCWYRLTVA